MRHITHQMAASVMNGVQATFDTHMLERRTLRLFPGALARELLRFSNTNDALHQFSAHFAKWIDNEFRGQIRKLIRF